MIDHLQQTNQLAQCLELMAEVQLLDPADMAEPGTPHEEILFQSLSILVWAAYYSVQGHNLVVAALEKLSHGRVNRKAFTWLVMCLKPGLLSSRCLEMRTWRTIGALEGPRL